MENEQEVNADNSELSRQIADAENLLNEGVTEETPDVQEVTEIPGIKEEPKKEEDHGEKSRLGRKVKFLEDKLSKLDSLDQKIEKLLQASTKHEEELPEIPTGQEVLELVDKRLEARETKKAEEARKAQESYQSRYISLLEDTVGDDEELRELLLAPDSPYNKTGPNSYFGDPAQDLLNNVTKAQRALRSKTVTPKPNVHGKPPTVPNGVNIPTTPTKTVAKKVDTSKWGKEERALAESGLFNDEELAELARI